MDDHALQRDLGRLEGKVEAQGDQLTELTKKFDFYHSQNSDKIDKLLSYQERQKGAARMLLLVCSSLSTTFGALTAWIVHKFLGNA